MQKARLNDKCDLSDYSADGSPKLRWANEFAMGVGTSPVYEQPLPSELLHAERSRSPATLFS